MNDNYTRYGALPDGQYISAEAWEEWGNDAQVFTKREGQWYIDGIPQILLDRLPTDLVKRPERPDRGGRAVVDLLMKNNGMTRDEAWRAAQATIDLLRRNMK